MTVIGSGQIRRFQYDRHKLALLLLAGMGFVGIGYWLAFHTAPGETRQGLPVAFVGWTTLVFFGFCTVVIMWKFRTALGRDTLVLTPTGLTDHHISPVEISWQNILNVAVIRVGRAGQPLLRLEMDPAHISQLGVSRSFAWLERKIMPGLRPGVTVSAVGLDVSFGELHDIVHAYWQSHHAQPPPKPPAVGQDHPG
ncbi:STM3941 family protein [Roseinatronobacter alkalisoli]|uniref:PH domain-containing protein n=1 Tax=Roseinatronobacter alkalisoli TaxID=3028235 RepID=A0ABT5TAF6_9RHOB|nr:STM3941 family protein [Roseinatronobacter sp. HJB301]MDD7971946.1 hypothetical protein [Roseinatronobacter sp. HJB301]